jgi:hypothetical protein
MDPRQSSPKGWVEDSSIRWTNEGQAIHPLVP